MRLLLAEDEQALARAVSVILEKGGYEVDVAYDGIEAYDRLSTGRFDGAVLDIMMPGQDGITVLRKLRKMGNPMPVLLLTAKGEVDDKVEGLDSGANDYLTKPFDAKELLARVRAMLHGQAAQTSGRLHMGNVTLDRSSNEMSTPSGSFRLSSREAQMLEMMLLSPGCEIDAERFLERIWGGEDAEDSAVVVYASYLGKKLAALHADVEVKHGQGGGYSLVASQ